MSFTVFLGNLPVWVTADDIASWLTAENLVADHVKVIRNPETQESKGFAFIDAPNTDEMQAIIKRFDRAPLEDRILRANPAQPPKARRPLNGPPQGGTFQAGPPQSGPPQSAPSQSGAPQAGAPQAGTQMAAPPRQDMAATDRMRGGKKHRKTNRGKPSTSANPSAFAEELAKAL